MCVPPISRPYSASQSSPRDLREKKPRRLLLSPKSNFSNITAPLGTHRCVFVECVGVFVKLMLAWWVFFFPVVFWMYVYLCVDFRCAYARMCVCVVLFVSVCCSDVCVCVFSGSRNLPPQLKSTFKPPHRSAPVTSGVFFPSSSFFFFFFFLLFLISVSRRAQGSGLKYITKDNISLCAAKNSTAWT